MNVCRRIPPYLCSDFIFCKGPHETEITQSLLLQISTGGENGACVLPGDVL